ncbi:VHS-domain-containing protein [Suhomyces tanzawaensis NRRL Y-17324]|uniref:VHS-domain-containing protein n=1 Tax=Suhomyces tanzawaensis NRRL Y-17324 TaxID=984487 RepID=A0A1E4SLH7_9ASCO|nr:VHS-domain-containing protein [Suhomyces tanzawaensis NRRL Y-17324]ODV80366.1 VHS-domain-containing protein [Suhomyces tanzawaensis NRRL Y-17324]
MSSGSYSLSKINPKLLRRIYRACRPTLNEPNLALNLEICDYINAKQGSTHRDAAIAVAKLISQRDPQTSELAISLLDNLVKNCGYPFHLQISRKEFLNELVKRFPERPPMRYTRVQRLVLAQIEEWYQTICRTSKYKDDFGYIKDMHRLLSNKGYVFPEVKLEDAAVLNPSDNLKTLEDIQKEESLVRSAKLQELIRRGRPQDLQEANKLMKIMAGFKDDHIVESKKQVSDDIARLKRKVEILAEMLNNVEGGGTSIQDNEAIGELYASVKSSQPIITKIIEEGHDNEDEVNDLLALNDNVNSVVSKFQFLKNGQVEEASKINVQGASGSANNDLNLIDFDDDMPISNDKRDDQGYNDLLSDLANISFGDNNGAVASANGSKVNPLDLYGAGGSIALGGNSLASSGTPLQQPKPSTSNDLDLLADFNSPSPQLQSNTNQANNSLDPFGFNFPSSTPSQVQSPSGQSPSGQYKSTTLINQSASLKVEIGILPSSTNQLFQGKILLSNAQSTILNQLKFLLAVPKSCKLNLKPQSGDVLYGFSNQGISQEFSIENSLDKPLKVKWKVEYVSGGSHNEETGVSNLS